MAVVFHDYFELRGGGERLALTAARALDAALVTASWSRRSLPQPTGLAIDIMGRATSLPLLRSYASAARFATAGRRYRDHRWHLYSGVCAPFAALAGGPRRAVYYCHTPPRFAYDQHQYYRARLPAPLRPLFGWVCSDFARRYQRAVDAVDQVVVNSAHVAARVSRYLGRDSVVVAPPVQCAQFHDLGDGGYYLSNARLDPLKRVDLVIEAFRKLPGLRLKVASDGPERARLQSLARGQPQIEFTGAVDDVKMQLLVGRCRALIYVPRDEDFGISPLEAMAAGKPVIVAGSGGLLETVVDGEHGRVLSADPSADEIAAAVTAIDAEPRQRYAAATRARAAAFDQPRFIESLRPWLG